MRLYLNGVEYRAYRKILVDFEVSFGCINYQYIWLRTPKFNMKEDCASFKEIMATPGGLLGYCLNDYVDFLNENADMISFALAPYPLKDCEVPIYTPKEDYEGMYITYRDIVKPFAPQKYKELNKKGAIIHGVDFEAPFLTSFNSGSWMRGKAGWVSEFTKDNKLRTHQGCHTVTAFARQLKEEGYKLNLDKVKRYDWREVAKVNCLAWKKYQDRLEEK
jgi:hypothetical protein